MAAGSQGVGRPVDLEDRLIRFGVRVMTVVEVLPRGRLGNHVAGQLVRCGTSGPANYAEARGGESRADFIHKLNIVVKELRETRSWLLMSQLKPLIKPQNRLDPIIREANEVIAVFVASVQTAKRTKDKQ